MYERNTVEGIVDSDRILCWNEKHIEQEYDHKNLQEIKIKYHSNHRKHRYKLADEIKKQPNRILIDKNLVMKVIVDCRITSARKYRIRLGFKKCNVILTKKQSALMKMKSSFEWENIITQLSMLGYRIDLYFHDYNLVIEIDENGLSDRNIAYEIKRKKTIEQELGCKLISTYPDKEDIDIFRTIN